ncbi:MAG: hypothetical protein FWE97_02620 [Dehalococcoidia bacterium]|nr:hypothetical protein [Dehalococcoidia bacterium]
MTKETIPTPECRSGAAAGAGGGYCSCVVVMLGGELLPIVGDATCVPQCAQKAWCGLI